MPGARILSFSFPNVLYNPTWPYWTCVTLFTPTMPRITIATTAINPLYPGFFLGLLFGTASIMIPSTLCICLPSNLARLYLIIRITMEKVTNSRKNSYLFLGKPGPLISPADIYRQFEKLRKDVPMEHLLRTSLHEHLAAAK